MKLFPAPQDRDDELLSAYLDDELSPAERAKLERRLQADSSLRAVLEGLRHVKIRLTGLSPVTPPRNFTLTPKLAGVRPPARPLPVLRWATSIAVVLLAVFVVTNLNQGLLKPALPNLAQAPGETELAFVAELPADAQVAASAEKSTTESPAPGLLPFQAYSSELSTEPLTNAGGGVGGSGGEGGGGAPPSEMSGNLIRGGQDTATVASTIDPSLPVIGLDSNADELQTPALSPTPAEAPTPLSVPVAGAERLTTLGEEDYALTREDSAQTLISLPTIFIGLALAVGVTFLILAVVLHRHRR